MARIIYGVSGEGSGHSSRARLILTHLLDAGHEVKVASYDRGYQNLSPDFDVLEIEGLHIAAEENKVSVVETFVGNVSRISSGIQSVRDLRVLFKSFEPDCAITDFEPMTAYLTQHYELPLISLDNQHRMRYMEYPCPTKLRADALVAETVIRAIVPRPDVSLVTTFYRGRLKNERTFLFPPILRHAVLDAEPGDAGHVLVYCTQSFESILEMLRQFPREDCLVYGFGRDAVDGNLTFKPASRDGFLEDLASAKAVIATAGFTLMTEALHLRKPYLALPMRGQFEQELNALLLETLGYGKNGRKATAETCGDFFYRLPEMKERLEGYPRNDNGEITAKLDELLADGCALAREFHRKRRERATDGSV
ncbi:MAG: glycosyltransferase family protein [Planctomycetota bacterium]|jgi:uncharacterized protein (TIGR00661 family)